jgi:hypothetical protein
MRGGQARIVLSSDPNPWVADELILSFHGRGVLHGQANISAADRARAGAGMKWRGGWAGPETSGRPAQAPRRATRQLRSDTPAARGLAAAC